MALAGTGAFLLPAACSPSAAGPSGASGQGGPAGADAWQALTAAAEQEGKLNAVSITGLGQRRIFELFHEAFPRIEVEHQAFSSASLIGPRLFQEREAGIYSLDVALLSTGSALREFRPRGVWDPIRDELFRPEVTGDQYWVSGFEDGFSDLERRWTYVPSMNAQRPFLINLEQVDPKEFTRVEDLLNPKWKGRMVWSDVRTGSTWTMVAIRENLGEEVLRRIVVEQNITYLRDARQLVDSVIRGKYAIGMAGNLRQQLREFTEQGVGKNVAQVDLDGASWSLADALFVFNQRPHPNAARLFLNWVLSKEGQELWVRAFDANSRRTDVAPVNPDESPIPGRKYLRSDQEENFDKIEETRPFVEKLLQR